MSDLGAQLRLTARRVVVLGGPPRALGVLGRLLARGAQVTVIAPQVATSVQDLAERGALTWHARPYATGDLAGAALVVRCDGPTLTGDTARTATSDAAAASDAADAADSADAADADAAAAGILVADLAADLVASAGDRALGSAPSAPAGEAVDDSAPRTRDELVAPGEVVLVGGGPGDPGLLTLAGLAAVRAADVVVVDRLAPLEVLRDLGPDVEVVDVAKIPRGRFTPQERINEVLLEHARAGRRVVRLKGGDSFVFGRGMEEVIACRDAGVPVRVIPGVTSAVAAPELAGIPVTHRGVVQGFAVISGHAAPDDPRSTVDWASLAASGVTVVVLMGVETLPRIAATLRDAGRPAQTPVACVMEAGSTRQRVVTSTIGDLAAGPLPAGVAPPAVTVIGDVAAFAATAPA